MIWICKLCEKEEHVHPCTNGIPFVLHHCSCFEEGPMFGASGNMRRYIANMQNFFQNPDIDAAINITVFPLRETV